MPSDDRFEEFCWGVVERQIGIGKRYLQPDMKLMPVRAQVAAYCDMRLYASGRGLLILGPVGTGKSTILAYIAHRIVKDRGVIVLKDVPDDVANWRSEADQYLAYISTTRLFDLFFVKGKSEFEAELTRLERMPVLMLEDLGREYRVDFPITRFEEFVEHRYANELATIVASNQTPDQLKEIAGFERVIDRFRDSGWMQPLVIAGKSKRQ